MSKYLLLGILLPIFFASCGTMNAIKNTASGATKGTMNAVKSTASSATKGIASATGKVTNSIPGLRPGIDVVEVREDDMKEMPLGKDRALAFEEKKKRSFWSFVSPANFKEPVLPEISDSEIDGSLLPPKPL